MVAQRRASHVASSRGGPQRRLEQTLGLAPAGADASPSPRLDVRAHPAIAESRMNPVNFTVPSILRPNPQLFPAALLIQIVALWLHDAKHSGVRLMQQFARTLSRDLDAVRNAIVEHWSSGQAERQINRLKTLKRAMYGRARIELLRARMLPFETAMCT